MPLTQSIPDLRHQIQELLTEDLVAALSALRDLLPVTTEKHDLVLTLQGRLKDANRERIRNTLSPDDYQRRMDTIRANCLELVNGLVEIDFEQVAAATTSKASVAKHGSVLYRVPHQMPLRKPSICTVRVAIDEDAIVEDIVFDDNVRLRQQVEVSDMMRAELLDPEDEVFRIRPLNEAEQLVRKEGYTQWLFSVSPQVEGEHQLMVKVSMMEYNAQLGRYVPRDVSVLETVTIVTDVAALPGSVDALLKATGDRFALGPDMVAVGPTLGLDPGPAEPSTAERPLSGIQSGARAFALFLVFILAGSSATWALTPASMRDWWITRYVKNDEQAYQAYIEKYEGQAVFQVETAYFRKTVVNPSLPNLRDYQQAYPEGRYSTAVLERIRTLEIKAIANLCEQPDTQKISQFVQDFPESERLPELRQVVDNYSELLPALENAYVASIRAQPSTPKVMAFLRDFPDSQRLPEVTTAAATQPAVLEAVQPALENAYLDRLQLHPDTANAEAFLEQFPVPTQRKRFVQIMAPKTALQRRFTKKIEQAATEQRTRLEAERLRLEQDAAEKARLEELQRRAREEGDAAERTHLEREAAAEAERLRREEEARRDTDGDGVPDQTDRCPGEKGDAANDGCPPEEGIQRRSGLEMVSVQGNTFTMGCLDGRDKDCGDDEKPAHFVTLSGYQIGKYEVTQADWRTVMSDNPSFFENCDDCPVERVSWDDIQVFLQKLNAQYPGKNYRLPTEAEWEYAARGGHKMQQEVSLMSLYAGGNESDKVAWYFGNSGTKTHPVGQKAPNALGMYDMSGNVYEWCSDKKDDYPADTQTNPKEMKSGSFHVYRGGSWYSRAPEYCRATGRRSSTPTYRFFDLGFRLARSSF